MERLLNALEVLKQLAWGPPVLFLLAAIGLYLTWALRGLQFKYLGRGMRLAVTSHGEHKVGDITPFQSLMTSLAAAIGTGNIAGVATAIATGGLGALFWMWVIALLGMATKYAESLLAVVYREKDEWGEMAGGPMYYIEKGLGWKWLAAAFALFASIAAIGTGNMVQANSVADAVRDIHPIDPLWIGCVLAVFTGAVLIGGVKSIGRVAGILVPMMALMYLLGGVWILWVHADRIPVALATILRSAFQGQAAMGGFLGSSVMLAIQMGISRGVFSNESGLGISSIAAAAAQTDCPAKQALIAMTGTFLSTIIVCSITGLVVAVTGTFGEVNELGQLVNGAPMVMHAFERVIPGGQVLVSIGLVLFAYSTMVAWAYYGEKCAEYFLGAHCIPYYRVLYTLLVIPGAILDLDLVWDIADVSNACMVVPNVIALFALRRVIMRESRRLSEPG